MIWSLPYKKGRRSYDQTAELQRQLAARANRTAKQPHKTTLLGESRRLEAERMTLAQELVGRFVTDGRRTYTAVRVALRGSLVVRGRNGAEQMFAPEALRVVGT